MVVSSPDRTARSVQRRDAAQPYLRSRHQQLRRRRGGAAHADLESLPGPLQSDYFTEWQQSPDALNVAPGQDGEAIYEMLGAPSGAGRCA